MRSAGRDELAERVAGAWHDPERLRALVLGALDDGLGREVLPAAERLRDIDGDPERGTLVLALALRGCAEHRRAEDVLVRHIRAHGGSADTWFALAPLASWRGSTADVDTALDNALRYDPNHADALAWGYKHQARRHDDAHALRWLEQRARDSWRATVMLGELALHRGDVDAAVERFAAACALHPRRPGPLDAAARALAAAGYDDACARLVVAHWTGSCGPWPLIEAVEACLRRGRAADAALALARLRGVELSPEAAEWTADLSLRVDAACLAAGI
ncbi:tetratricopeptide repeat protein [Marinactinospora rubrisoli]|uniref:Tetratricopeptide repeat protein n=1 Tax=Marinactinospora rubrisoli TaxID=2715399 RepID=A0ABW2KBX1_9ACTN